MLPNRDFWEATGLQKCEKCLILLARSERFELPTLRFEVGQPNGHISRFFIRKHLKSRKNFVSFPFSSDAKKVTLQLPCSLFFRFVPCRVARFLARFLAMKALAGIIPSER
jgi:hypothetical protein